VPIGGFALIGIYDDCFYQRDRVGKVSGIPRYLLQKG
jgi:hypothetical protein